MHTVSQQLNVPRAEAKEVAESLLDAKLVCTLGGEYGLREVNGLPFWSSSAWSRDSVPYQAPLMEWFRGLETRVLKEPDRLLVHAELDMLRKPNEAKVELPLFNFLSKPKNPAEPAQPASAKKRGREF